MAVASAAGISSRTTARAAIQARNNWVKFLRTTPSIAFRLPLDLPTDRDIAWPVDFAHSTRLSHPPHRLFRAIDKNPPQSLSDIWSKQVSWEFLAQARHWADQAPWLGRRRQR